MEAISKCKTDLRHLFQETEKIFSRYIWNDSGAELLVYFLMSMINKKEPGGSFFVNLNTLKPVWPWD